MAKFKKGEPRPAKAGRKKGSLNKTTRALKAVETFNELGIYPVQMILKLLPQLSPDAQVRTLLELQEYVEAKPRAVEVKVSAEQPRHQDPMLEAHDVTPQQLLEAAQEED